MVPRSPGQQGRETAFPKSRKQGLCTLSLSLFPRGPGCSCCHCCAGPGDPATYPHSGIRDSLPSHGSSCIPLSVPPILLSLCSQRVACLPKRPARVRRGLTPASPSPLLNQPDSRRFTPSLCPHRTHPAPARPCQCRATQAGPPSAGRFVQLRKVRSLIRVPRVAITP